MTRNIAENLNRLTRVHERYRQTDDRRQTDGRAIAYVSSRSLTTHNLSNFAQAKALK